MVVASRFVGGVRENTVAEGLCLVENLSDVEQGHFGEQDVAAIHKQCFSISGIAARNPCVFTVLVEFAIEVIVQIYVLLLLENEFGITVFANFGQTTAGTVVVINAHTCVGKVTNDILVGIENATRLVGIGVDNLCHGEQGFNRPFLILYKTVNVSVSNIIKSFNKVVKVVFIHFKVNNGRTANLK